jgi:hypothetical protein
METDAYKQYKIHRDETDCYGWNVSTGCTRVSTLYEHGLGGIDMAVPLMRKNMDTECFKPNDCLGWSLDQPAGCGGCFYTHDGGQTFKPFPYLYNEDTNTKKKTFPCISIVWMLGTHTPKTHVEYFERCMKHIKHGGPYTRICDFSAGFEMDLIHTEYPYISGSWYSGTLGPS